MTAARMKVAPALRRFDGACFQEGPLLEQKKRTGASVSVVVPARDEEATIGSIVGTLHHRLVEELPLIDEIVVVDDGSRDATAEAAAFEGARVVAGPRRGKGEAMAAGLEALSLGGSRDDLVVFLDGDVVEFRSSFVTGLLGPLLTHEGIDLVKASYRRPIDGQPSGGGRVTELVAKPALELLFPQLSRLGQPLSGEAAARASLLAKIDLAGGYAVEIAMLLDTLALLGPGAIAEVDLEERRHRNRSLEELVPQAKEVLAAILERGGALP